MTQAPQLHSPTHPVRFVTASALFDGHDASINIMRRIMQSQGAEVIHLGHNRSVQEVVDAAIEEDVQGVAVSSYQGGHVEYFEYLTQLLREQGAGHVKVFGGGGGVIVPEEITRLREAGVTIFSPEDGQRLGLPGMINTLIADCDTDVWETAPVSLDAVLSGDRAAIARAISGAELGHLDEAFLEGIAQAAQASHAPVLGLTGTGGSGKSSLTDELVRRFRVDQQDKLRIAVIAVDPTRRKGGGALLGDRIRMNSLGQSTGGVSPVFFRSLATRGDREVPEAMQTVIDITKAAGYDLVIIETPGIGQGDAAIVPFVDVPMYVMTPEFGAASQLEKIDMLDFAEVVAINKFERRGAADALRDVARQIVRNREAFGQRPEEMPVFGTSAATFNDDGVTALYQHLRDLLADKGLTVDEGQLAPVDTKYSTRFGQVVPATRVRYLAEITDTVRGYHSRTEQLADGARRVQRLAAVDDELTAAGKDGHGVDELLDAARKDLPAEVTEQIERWPAIVESYSGDEQVVTIRGKELHTKLTKESLSGTKIPRVALPKHTDHGDLVTYWRSENLPGSFPYTAGVFPFKRDNEDPARMFAGEGDPFRTNRRFKLLSEGQPAT
ncbi:MAG: methylmalonyl-CoA mutase family protein, partial [Janibacter sp.]|nr:methylmalonyl-CoA mutase family protein [Janibacter sp.]